MSESNTDDALQELEQAIWPNAERIPRRLLVCRHCGQRNRVTASKAVLGSKRHRCGACDKPLFLAADEPLYAIASAAYQHSLDRRSLSALRSLPGAPLFARWLVEQFGDRTARILFMSEAILCGEEQFPELLRLMEKARKNLDLEVHPVMFLGESPHMNAMTTGVREPVIVVRSALLDQMNDAELVCVLGHELGHLHAGHPLYAALAQLLLQGGLVASQLLRLLSLPMHRTLLRWTRCAELTADRAALLASRDLYACISMMLTFAGGNRPGTSRRTSMKLSPFIRQCRELARMHAGEAFDTALGEYLSQDRSHPHLAWRVMHLIRWVEHGNYLNILSGQYRRRRQARGGTPLSLPAEAGVVPTWKEDEKHGV